MVSYKYRLIEVKVIEQSTIEAGSRDEALETIYQSVEDWASDTDTRFEIEWLDGKETN